jgi:RNA polymerase sigma-70 factor (ECF subfamily)
MGAKDHELAAAAAAGSSQAIAELERRLAVTITRLCRQFAGNGHTVDDLRQILRAKLFVAHDDGMPAIARYDGGGSLETWVRVTATRLFIDLRRRKDRARETPSDPAKLDAIGPRDLELDVARAEYRGAILAALAEAARALEPGDRHLLRQHLVARLTGAQLATMLGVHRATITRRLARARDTLVTRTRALVAARLALTESELDEQIGVVVSKLDITLRRILESTAA